MPACGELPPGPPNWDENPLPRWLNKSPAFSGTLRACSDVRYEHMSGLPTNGLTNGYQRSGNAPKACGIFPACTQKFLSLKGAQANEASVQMR